MGEIRIKRVPEELMELLKAEAERLGMDVRAVCLMRLWGTNGGSHEGPNRGPMVPRVKFVPPTEVEAAAEIRAKGYHFTAGEFVAWNGARGWRTKQGPLKDWRQAMVTWESRWREKQGPKKPELKFVRVGEGL